MSESPPSVRTTAYAQHGGLSPLDRFGVWLSARRLDRIVGDPTGRDVIDLGCGYEARYARRLAGAARHVTVTDVALSPELAALERVSAVEGALPDSVRGLAAHRYDVVMCMSVLEHVYEPLELLAQCRRLVAPGGVCVVNVPTWLGKRFLELAAFRLHLAPFEEMDDHKRYYDPRDLWPMLVEAGFRPHEISCRRHKFGLNTIAVCRTDRS